ncbi:MAG: 30S ribosomal protein S3 [bacterium]|nr:30S ribosomal protein S3 [bacterium]
MGQKVHPYGFRLGVINGWQSRWFAERNFAEILHEDLRIRDFIKKKVFHAGISKVVIERRADKMSVNIHTARPGILIGKRGADVDALRKELGDMTSREVFINIREVRKAEIDAQLIAENIGTQLVRRVAFRRAMKKSISAAMKFGAQGVKIKVSGRLGGAEMSRTTQYREGRVPLHTLKAAIDYGSADAKTTYGVIGVKVWVFNGYVPDSEMHDRRLGLGDEAQKQPPKR